MASKPIASISGIRGIVGESLTPASVLALAQSFGSWLPPGPVVLGRDSRITGEMLKHAAIAGLIGSGRHVIDVDIVPTPTVGIMVKELGAAGGIVLTASHNPIQWNALKFYGGSGTFLDAAQFEEFYCSYQEVEPFNKPWFGIGQLTTKEDALEIHKQKVLDAIDVQRIRDRKFKVALDACRGAGSVVTPDFLRELGCEVLEHDCVPDGRFTREAEPTPKNLEEFGEIVKEAGVDIGFALDPDADRLVLVAGSGQTLCEEFTLAVAADYMLSKQPGPIAANLASTMLLDDIAKKHGVECHRTKIGEINVTTGMQKVGAVIGGEGNGGVIYPPVYSGRDALTGIGIILEALAVRGISIQEWVDEYPAYHIVKDKIPAQGLDIVSLKAKIESAYPDEEINMEDGIKVIGKKFWLSLRASNTEPIIRITAEAESQERASEYIEQTKRLVL